MVEQLCIKVACAKCIPNVIIINIIPQIQIVQLKTLFVPRDNVIFDCSSLTPSFLVFRYNIAFIAPSLGGFSEIFPSVMTFPSG